LAFDDKLKNYLVYHTSNSHLSFARDGFGKVHGHIRNIIQTFL
jgi:hypothetical protein